MINYKGIAATFVLVAALTLLVWAYWAGHSGIIFGYWLHGRGNDSAAQWGDSFGALNALFTALGFSAVLATLIAQMKSASDQQCDQHRQRFDATFFEMLHMIKELRAELRFQYSRDYINLQTSKTGLTVTHEGREAITYAAGEMRFWIGKIRKKKTGNQRQICEKYMLYVHGRYESRFSPYFRMIYAVMSKISKDKVLNNDEKIYYGNILRGQLNKYEVALLAINSTAPVAGDLSKYISEFRMLKYLPGGVVRNSLLKLFPKTTFEGRGD